MRMRRLPLQGAYNVRDLGGYATERGSTTQFGRFVRMDSPATLTDADLDVLVEYGVTVSVDLRSLEEERVSPSRFAHVPTITIQALPIADDIQANLPDVEVDSMETMYLYMLEELGERLVRALRVLATAKGCAVYHCTAGKDRTGLISAILLKNAGVADVDIIADYALTPIYMKQPFQAMRDMNIPEYCLLAEPEYMESVLRYWKDKGGLDAWIGQNGGDAALLDALRERLLEA